MRVDLETKLLHQSCIACHTAYEQRMLTCVYKQRLLMIAIQSTVQLHAWYTLASFADFVASQVFGKTQSQLVCLSTTLHVIAAEITWYCAADINRIN